MSMNIAIVTGGETGEREISLRSAQNVAKNIGFGRCELFVFPEDQKTFLDRWSEFDVAIPVIHGLGGEDGQLQTLFESLSLPYIFSGIQAHATGIDKIATRKIARAAGLVVAKQFFENHPSFPLFAKPRFGGSSLATKICNTPEELKDLEEENPGTEFILEEPLKGREFTVGVINEKNSIRALPVIEIIPKSKFFDFESKYDPKNLAQEICPADISPELTEQLQDSAIKAHIKINAHHISRSDFIYANDKIYFLEINTIPGLTDTSLVPKMLKAENLELKDLLRTWCEEVVKK